MLLRALKVVTPLINEYVLLTIFKIIVNGSFQYIRWRFEIYKMKINHFWKYPVFDLINIGKYLNYTYRQTPVHRTFVIMNFYVERKVSVSPIHIHMLLFIYKESVNVSYPQIESADVHCFFYYYCWIWLYYKELC